MNDERRDLWTIRLSDEAEADFLDIIQWTWTEMGERQAAVYAAALSATIGGLGRGRKAVGVRSRADVDEGLFDLRVRARRGGRHLLMIRFDDPLREVRAVRILYDGMDLAAQIRR